MDALYYAYLNEYPDSIILPLRAAGYETMVFIGLEGSSMNMNTAYPKMGFQKLFFASEIAQGGYPRRSDMFMRHIPDADVFAFAVEHRPQDAAFLHFLVTLTMHGGSSVRMTEDFADHEYYDALHYFDKALAGYLDALDAGSVVIVYGDHQSYNGPERTGQVPFIVYIKGEELLFPVQDTVFTRCELSHYLKKLFLTAASGTPDKSPQK
jgi:phosphoglycerol transferase MdoB-like AlkP superfamily enzyme